MPPFRPASLPFARRPASSVSISLITQSSVPYGGEHVERVVEIGAAEVGLDWPPPPQYNHNNDKENSAGQQRPKEGRQVHKAPEDEEEAVHVGIDYPRLLLVGSCPGPARSGGKFIIEKCHTST